MWYKNYVADHQIYGHNTNNNTKDTNNNKNNNKDSTNNKDRIYSWISYLDIALQHNINKPTYSESGYCP